MSVATQGTFPPSNVTHLPGTPAKPATKPLNRIAEVRQEQGISLRSAARHLQLDIATVRAQEDPHADLKLSDLLKWQQLLEVPLADLLVDPGTALSRPVLERARMVRLMKTAAAIAEQSKAQGVQRMATMLVEQLVEIMPELADVSPWHSVGQRRSLTEYGRVVERRLCDDYFSVYHDD